jgi:hypothetical protein
MNRIDNTLTFKIAFAIYPTRVELLGLECSRLPWIAAAGVSSGLPLQSVVQSHLLPLLNGHDLQPDTVCGAITGTAVNFSEFLKSEFAVCCSTRLDFVFEEQHSKAIDKLTGRLAVEDPERFLKEIAANSPLGEVSFKGVEEISKQKAQAITPENFSIPSPEVEVVPGRGVSFALKSKEPVIVREFRIFCREHLVLQYRTPVHFDANGKKTIRLPGIPVCMYRHLLWEPTGKLRLELVLEGRAEPLALQQELEHQEIVLQKPPLAAFLDVGSALSKFLVVDLPIDAKDTPEEPSRLAEVLKARLKQASNGEDEGVFLEGPHSSKAFVEQYGISRSPKRKLDKYNDEELAAHFARSIGGLAHQFYRSENRLLGPVFWAFPNTKGRDFGAISAKVNELLGGTLLGEARIVPESDCLRASFSGALHALSEAAKQAVEERRDAKETNRRAEESDRRIHEAWDEYQQRPWYEKALAFVTGQKPSHPSQHKAERVCVPSLRDWHREFSRLECDKNLSEFLIFDAGGYSLDIFAAFADSSSDEISLSVAAGSTVINDALAEKLRKANPNRSEGEIQENAEKVKTLICSAPEKAEQHAHYALCREATLQNYGPHFDKVLDQVHDRVLGRGFPIILTGGGSRNRFLQQMLQEKLKSRGLATVLINSPLLYTTLRTVPHRSHHLRLFLCMASAFHPEEDDPRMAPFSDVLGGLAQLAIRR